jgi:catechol 2,3-dioxygenase-like lactoylglutathione lyase family enzyme
MPNLENCRKRAKQLLRWHRDGYYPVAARIRAVLPRFHALGDAEVLKASFKLGDAQELVAREAGFENWQALKQGLPTMSDRPTAASAAPRLTSAEPQLFVTDMKRACDFFTRKLGFAIEFLYGEPPFYGQVARDSARLNLRHVDRPGIDDALRRREDLLSAAITADDVKALFLEFQAADVPFHQTLRTEPWGARTFIVTDPDGNLVLFGGRAGT